MSTPNEHNGNVTVQSSLSPALSRRMALKAGAGVAITSLFGLTACGGNSTIAAAAGKVTKITPKQVRVIPLMTRYRMDTGYLKYTNQCVLIGGPDLTMWILKQQGR